MNPKTFAKLVTSVRQAGQIARGRRRPARVTVFRPVRESCRHPVASLRWEGWAGPRGHATVWYCLRCGAFVNRP
jgi:hypothetical protein